MQWKHVLLHRIWFEAILPEANKEGEQKHLTINNQTRTFYEGKDE